MAVAAGMVSLQLANAEARRQLCDGIQNQWEDLPTLGVTKEFLNPPELPDWEHVFSQIVVVTSGVTKTIYISGQVSVDQEKHLIGAGDLGAQALQAFQNLETALHAVAATTSDVVKLNIHIKNYQPADAVLINAALRRFLVEKNLPASTWLGVESLAEVGFLIEVDAIAVVETN